MTEAPDDVPPHGHVVHDRHQVAAEDVQHRDQGEHDDEGDEHPGQRVVTGVRGRVGADRQVDEGGAAVGDAGGDRDETDQVEPAGEEAGLGPTQLGRPPVDAARGRVGRHQLGHREADDEDEHAEDRPGPRDRDRTTVVEPGAEVGEAPGQDRDDRERDRKVGEPRPGPVQVLLVAQLGETAFVIAHLRRISHQLPPEKEVRPRSGLRAALVCDGPSVHLRGGRPQRIGRAAPRRVGPSARGRTLLHLPDSV